MNNEKLAYGHGGGSFSSSFMPVVDLIVHYSLKNYSLVEVNKIERNIISSIYFTTFAQNSNECAEA